MALVTRRVFLAGLSPLTAATRRSTGKRSRVPSRSAVFPDPLTERLKWRLTDPDVLHHLPHYHHRFIARNNSFMLLASERTGLRQIYRLHLPKGDMVQLTDGPGVHSYSPTFDRKEKNFFLLQGNELKRLSTKNGRERRIYRSEPGWRMTGHLSVSSGARYAAVVEMKEEDWVDDGFEQQFRARPRCRIQVVDLRGGRAEFLIQENQWLAHPQFRPRSRDVLYCHEGPWGQVDARLWLMSPAARLPKNLRPRQGEEQLGHEYWSGFGHEVCYVFYPDGSGRGASVRCVNTSNGRERLLSRCTRFGWLTGNHDNSAIIGASRSVAGPNIYVLFPRLRREVTVCEHDSSAKPYPIAGTDGTDPFAACPEPVFSPDSQLIYFVSDREGKPAIYRTGVPDLVEKTEREQT